MLENLTEIAAVNPAAASAAADEMIGFVCGLALALSDVLAARNIHRGLFLHADVIRFRQRTVELFGCCGRRVADR